jgi:hypothetical protein
MAMSRISIPSFSITGRSLREQASSSEHREFRLSSAAGRVAAGITAALAAAAAAFCIFGPFADLSAMQLAAGPRSTAVGPSGRLLVMAHTGRSWGAEQERRVAAASAVPLATLARNGVPDMVGVIRPTK